MTGMLKPAVAAISAWSLATIDIQPYLTAGGIVLALALGWRAFKVRDFSGEIDGLKSALNTAEVVKKTDDERRIQLEEQLSGASKRADVAEELVKSMREEVREWRARYDERAAGASLSEVKEILAEMAKQQQKRDQQNDRTFEEMRELIKVIAGAR